MSYISESLRREITERAGSRCEYCLIHQSDSFYRHEIDHIIPQKHRGETSEQNLCLACLDCNRHKGSDFGSFDPDTGQITALFNPRTQVWTEHFQLQGAQILPVTAEGRVTVFVLNMNDGMRIRIRRILLNAGRYPADL
jgi:hypothetical protein